MPFFNFFLHSLGYSKANWSIFKCLFGGNIVTTPKILIQKRSCCHWCCFPGALGCMIEEVVIAGGCVVGEEEEAGRCGWVVGAIMTGINA